jgi:hypothetical protein
MTTRLLYDGREFPQYIFTDKVKAYLFVEFDMVFVDRAFWKLMRDYLEISKINSIIVLNLDPDYYFSQTIQTNSLPNAFLELVRNESLEGFYNFAASLQMITNRAVVFSREEDEFCIVLDRNYSIAIIGFTSNDHIGIFKDYIIKDILDYLEINFAGQKLPASLQEELCKNWNLR